MRGKVNPSPPFEKRLFETAEAAENVAATPRRPLCRTSRCDPIPNAQVESQTVKLSLLVPSNRTGIDAYARLLSFLTFAGDDVEVVIRDNSGNNEKADFLRRFAEGNRRIIIAEPCPAWENGRRVLDEARGEFVLWACDDDMANKSALPSIFQAIEQHGADPGVIGVTGKFLIERPNRSELIAFPQTDAPDVTERVTAYITCRLPNTLAYSVLRRQVNAQVLAFINSMPFQASYCDFIINLLTVLMGRLVYVDHMLYQYDIGNWSDPALALREDLKYYGYAGLDASAYHLHWLIGAFEGAKAVAAKFTAAAHVPGDQRLSLGYYWFRHRYAWFKVGRQVDLPHARFNAQGKALAAKWRDIDVINMKSLLADLSEFFALSSPELGQRYYDFWN